MPRDITPDEDRARKQIGAFIRARRLRLELQMNDAADTIGINRLRLLRYEKGQSSIPAEILPRIAKVIKTSCEAILKEAA